MCSTLGRFYFYCEKIFIPQILDISGHSVAVAWWDRLRLGSSESFNLSQMGDFLLRNQEAINNDTTAGKATRDQRKLGQIRTRRSEFEAFLQSGQGQI